MSIRLAADAEDTPWLCRNNLDENHTTVATSRKSYRTMCVPAAQT
jgi:hypothetical protein